VLIDDSPLGVAVIGTGAAAAQHLEALGGASKFQVRVVCEPLAVRGGTLPEWTRAYPVATSLDAAYGADIDVVAVCTPPGTHAELAHRALRSGKAVVVEKPPVLDEAELSELIRERDRAGRPVGVMFQHRFILPPEVRAVAWSERTSACLEVCRPRPRDYFEKAPWRSSPTAAAGGVVPHLASHYLDLACQLLGVPDRMEGLVACDHHPGIDTRVSGAIHFASGVMLALACTTNVEHRTERLVVRDGSVTLEIENGRVRFTAPQGSMEAAPRAKPDLRRAVYAEVARALRRGELVLPTADVGAARGVVRLIEGVRALATTSLPYAPAGGVPAHT
jgi:predicted dehydrogenase